MVPALVPQENYMRGRIGEAFKVCGYLGLTLRYFDFK
jgi:hypothetical protein